MNEFSKLGIKESLLRVIEEEKFETPTEVQSKTIPLVLEGKDVIAGSATGSGKTLAFSARIIQEYKSGAGIQALILTPTRELAIQVTQAFKTFAKYNKLRITAVYGGVGINPQIATLRKADVVVGTPGRVLDHMERRTIDFSGVKTLILDEADRMLDMGFIDDVERIINKCPKDRQTLLFSATISTGINKLCHRYMNNPIKIQAKSHVDPKKLEQVYYDVDDKLKFSLLVHLLKKEHVGLIMIFCNTRRNADFVARNVKSLGIDALAIHGGFSQQKRTKTMETFNSSNLKVLVCTDVAARGLDIKGVSHVYNYDIPKDAKEYVHRIGRTARAGKEGRAINILSQRDHENFTRVQRENIELKIKKLELPEFQRANIQFKDSRGGGSQDRRGGGGFRGGRSGGGFHGSSGGRGSSRGPSHGQRSSYGSRDSSSSGRSSDSQGLSRSERRAREKSW